MDKQKTHDSDNESGPNLHTYLEHITGQVWCELLNK